MLNNFKTESTTQPLKKFDLERITAKGEPRARVNMTGLKTLWFNTGTLCNLACTHCYIESTPKNDRLVYITANEVTAFLDEIAHEGYPVTEIGLTGGEPFMNKEIIPIITECLSRGYQTLVLTNAMRPMQRHKHALIALNNHYPDQLKIRVSVDHFIQEKHEQERGPKSWQPMITGLKWLQDNSIPYTVAGRTLWGDTIDDMRKGFAHLFEQNGLTLNAQNPQDLIIFPEMDETADVPEITTACWNILGKSPKDMMCASSRMVVKRKGAEKPVVLACTLLAYDTAFEMGSTLKEAMKPIYLNHPHCAKFCVLGGASCSA